MSQLDEIERAAKKAHARWPGYWRDSHDGGKTVCEEISTDPHGSGTCTVLAELEQREGYEDIAEHMAQADPLTVMLLVVLARVARKLCIDYLKWHGDLDGNMRHLRQALVALGEDMP